MTFTAGYTKLGKRNQCLFMSNKPNVDNVVSSSDLRKNLCAFNPPNEDTIDTTASGTVTITETSPTMIIYTGVGGTGLIVTNNINSGSNLQYVVFVYNRATNAGNITVKDKTGTSTLVTLAPGEGAFLSYNGSTQVALKSCFLYVGSCEEKLSIKTSVGDTIKTNDGCENVLDTIAELNANLIGANANVYTLFNNTPCDVCLVNKTDSEIVHIAAVQPFIEFNIVSNDQNKTIINVKKSTKVDYYEI